MMKCNKKIIWVTPDCFLDTDLNYDVMYELLKIFDIHWLVYFSLKSRFKESDFKPLLDQNSNLTVDFFYTRKRERNPQKILEYLEIGKIVKKEKVDVVYLNLGPTTPWQIPMYYTLPKAKTIVTAHQGRVHEGMGHYMYYNFLRGVYYGRFRNVNMFSKSQAELFKVAHPKSKIYQFLLGLKYFGEPTNKRLETGDIRFLSFGTINYAKNVDLLIDAACLLHERGVRGFKVSFNGMCKDWSWYQQRIKYPEIFETDIRMIDNSEIPNLFNGSHYLVQPYRVVSQSGPTKIAFQYNLPILASNLPGFTDEIEEGINGYIFEKGNVEDLADKMQMLIKNHKTIYPKLLESGKAYTEEHYSIKVLAKQYIDMFNEVAGL